MSRILVVEDEALIREMFCQELQSMGHLVIAESLGKKALKRAHSNDFDVILLDLMLPDVEGLELLTALQQVPTPAEIIIVSAHGNIATAVEALRLGAFDFLEKPCRLIDLETAVNRAAQSARIQQDNGQLRKLLGATDRNYVVTPSAHYLGGSDKMARSPLPILITGPTGSGKEVVARQLHQKSDRQAAPFLVIDCTALQANLIESELFGHERGAFTGAHQAQPGLVETAHGGTLFLDEIGELEAALQSKLLRLLETGEYRKVGGREWMNCSARIIAATHRDLKHEVAEGIFREDLYYRLNVLQLTLPPLEKRPDEIPGLAKFFLKRCAGSRLQWSGDALKLLTTYAWPGNIRELRNLTERLSVLVDGPQIEACDLEFDLKRTPSKMQRRAVTLAALEQQHILATLEQNAGNKTHTAEQLGISPQTLYNKLERYSQNSGD